MKPSKNKIDKIGSEKDLQSLKYYKEYRVIEIFDKLNEVIDKVNELEQERDVRERAYASLHNRIGLLESQPEEQFDGRSKNCKHDLDTVCTYCAILLIPAKKECECGHLKLNDHTPRKCRYETCLCKKTYWDFREEGGKKQVVYTSEGDAVGEVGGGQSE